MTSLSQTSQAKSQVDFAEESKTSLQEMVHDVAHLLPGQAPIGAFVHHNTLHVFEHLPFHEAVKKAHTIFGANPYMSLEEFREALREKRIQLSDIDTVLKEWYPEEENLPANITRKQLYRTALRYPLETSDEAHILWTLHQKKLLEHWPKEAAKEEAQAWCQEAQSFLEDRLTHEDPKNILSRFCSWEEKAELEAHLGCSLSPSHLSKALSKCPTSLALRYLWSECTRLSQQLLSLAEAPSQQDEQGDTQDSSLPLDEWVHPILSRLSACFLDTGMAYWPMPDRKQGFYRAVRQLFQHSFYWIGSWIQEAKKQFTNQQQNNLTAEEAVLFNLHQLEIPQSQWKEVIQRELLALPGWAGMFYRLESKEQDRLRSFPYSLMDYLAVRLTLRSAIEIRTKTPSPSERDQTDPSSQEETLNWLQPAYTLFQLFTHTATPLRSVANLTEKDAWTLYEALQNFDNFEQQAVFQEAYEHHYRCEILDAVAANAKLQRQSEPPSPSVQLAFCIDDREESLRRHIEEYDAKYETYGIAGFYGLSIAYKGLSDAHRVPLCPASQKPTHKINEIPENPELGAQWNRRFALAGQLGFAGYVGTKSMMRGFLFSLAGVLEAFPMLLRLLSPRLGHQLRTFFREKALRPPRTKLTSIAEETTEENVGFSPDEAISRIKQVLSDMGLTSHFARLVVVLGHGSTSMNNPHEAAHECGACSGGKGGPNARLFADLVNRPDVRQGLRQQGIDIPDDTVFIGGMHDTSNDAVDLYDLHKVPTSHHAILEETQKALLYARTMDAHERCRRFASVPLKATPEQALRHVEGRAQNLAEPRPEYGHCTNSICIVGRRWLQRGLFLDRRAFLVSYDPTQDPDGEILEGLLASVGPVGAGINLEYYFSYVDQEKYGSGTKLPHNVTGLVGVMNGHESDLRTGLPYQMVDIHEPMRLLTIVEATTEQLLRIAKSQPAVGKLVQNEWIQLIAMDPETGELSRFTSRGFVPYQPTLDLPEFPSSLSYYREHRENLAPVRILSGLKEASHA